MEHKKPFKLFNKEELSLYEPLIETLFVSGPTWNDYKTRTANRKFISLDPLNLLEYDFLHPIVYKILECSVLSISDQNDNIIPIQLFVNYYENGKHSTPMHAHGCRQLTLAFGAPRPLKVNTKNYILEPGEAILLNGQKHGVPKVDEKDVFFNSPRISFNLFYTTTKEMRLDVHKMR